MAKQQIGERVGAMIGSDKETKTIKFLGWGEYIGDTVPVPEAGGFNLGIPNPTIKLDSGKTCYGCETWWGDEAGMKAQIAAWEADGWTVKIVDIDDERAAAKAA